MAEEIMQGGNQVAEAAAQAVAPDEFTASLLAKHSAGEKLSPAQYGKLGAWAKKAKNFITGNSGAPAGHAQPGPGQPALVDTLASNEAPGDLLPAVPIDPRLVQRTTESIIKACDGIARRKVAAEARRAGADERTLARFESAAAVPVAARDMMVETSPDVAAALGLDPKAYPIATFLGGVGIWATNLWLCVDELRAIAQQKEQREKEARKAEPPARSASPSPALTPGQLNPS